MTTNTHEQITDKIKSSALLVSLHLGRYNPVKTDRSESSKVLADHNIRDPKLLKVKKHTLPTAEVLDKIEKLDNKLRATLDKFTAPYARGVGLLPASKFLELRTALTPLLDERDELKRRFADQYSVYLDGAKRELNGAFKDSDYPPVDKVVAQFHHKLDVFPIADPRDTKLNVLGDIADSIGEAVEATFRDKAEGIVPHLVDILLDPLVKYSETLQNPDAKFKDSLVGNLNEACDRVRSLNILDDEHVETVAAGILTKLNYSADELREHKAVRKLAADAANALIEELGGSVPAPKQVKKSNTVTLPLDAKPGDPAYTPQLKDRIAAEVAKWTQESVTESTPLTEALEEVQPADQSEALLAKLGW
jgi:hypothetical protein